MVKRLVLNAAKNVSEREINDMAGIAPDRLIAEHNTKSVVPKEIRPQYIENFGYFSRANIAEFLCFCLERYVTSGEDSCSQKIYYAPSGTLMSTVMLQDEDSLRVVLGEKDKKSPAEQGKIESIIDYLTAASDINFYRNIKKTGTAEDKKKAVEFIRTYGHVEKKRMHRMLSIDKDFSAYFSGHGQSSVITGKLGDTYTQTGKQFVTANYNRNEIIIPLALTAGCTCGLSIHSKEKDEFSLVNLVCHHEELQRRILSEPELADNVRIFESPDGKPLKRISNIFTPFSPLDHPENGSPNLRNIIRQALWLFLEPQMYLLHYYNDSKQHKHYRRNNSTIFRTEMDALLLSNSEIYTPELLTLWDKYSSNKLSEKITCQYFGDYKRTELKDVHANHVVNALKGTIEHEVKGKLVHIEHMITNNKTGKQGLINEKFLKHNEKTLEHEFVNTSADINDYTLTHKFAVYAPKPDFKTPFKAARLPNGVKMYIAPYKLRKDKSSRQAPK